MNRQKHEKGAVLVVALVMLAMVTFLVVAFVGFARFERASVTASMRQTEANFASQDAMAIASGQIINLMTNGLPFGLRVSERTNFNQFVPVYIDTNGDGKQDRNSTYLNLNSETNRIPNPLTPRFDDAFGFQDANHTVNRLGDPEWIGILKDSSRPHGPDNRFVARAAFMTVPLSRSLNVRYHHHVNLNQPVPAHVRSQGLKHGEINLAAPLYHIDPTLFSLPRYNPNKYANAFHGLGSAVGDAINYSRPSVEFNRNLGMGFSAPTGTPAGKLSYDSANAILNFQQWFSHSAHRNATNRFYRFMETFSAAELPVDDNRFDVSAIRDQSMSRFAFTVDMGGSDTIVFLNGHPFSSGDKVSVSSQVSPNIWDPIDWKKDPATLSDWQQLFASGVGSFNSVKPHKLIFGDDLEIQVPKINASGNTLRLIIFNAATGAWQPLPVRDKLQILQYIAKSTSANEELQDTLISVQFPTALDVSKHYWGSKEGGVWVPKYKLNFDSLAGNPATELPPEFKDKMLVVRYRNVWDNPWPLDPIPYYVKVISPSEVSLHRSPLLDNFSRVNFVNPVGGTPAIVTSPYNTSNKCFMNSSFVMPFSSSNSLKWEKDLVRFTGATMPVDISTGKTFTDQDVFIVKKPVNLNPTYNLFQLRHISNPATRIDFKGSGPYQLQRVHQFKYDPLTESVEKMAGAMLNESIDVEGSGATAIVKVGDQPISLPPSNPGERLRLGIGAKHSPLGPWHETQKGIPWGQGIANFSGQGSYSPEIERIIQVAANIGDLYSGYNGPHLKVGPREIVSGGSNVNGPVPHVLGFGEYSRDAHVQATITQIDKGPHGRPGLVLCYRTEETKPYSFPYYRIRYTDNETSRATPGGLTKPGYARIELMLHNETLLAQSGEFLEPSGPFELKAVCERGREVKVYLNGKLVIHHEHSEPLAGQVGLMVANGNWRFTNISPRFTPSSTGQHGLTDPGASWNWGLPYRDTNPATQHGNPFPTAYQGVFNRDEFNNTYLTGLQRVTQLGASSWYQRGAPKVLGVKDRNGVYNKRMPAFNEVSLRVAYDRNNNRLRGKLSAEVDVPQGYGSVYKIKISNLKLSGERVTTYTPNLMPDTEQFSIDGSNVNTTLSKVGYVTYGGSWFPISSSGPRTKSGTGPVPSSLSDIQLQNLQLRMYVEVSNRTTGRIIDFFEGVLPMSQTVSLGNPAQDPLYAPVWNQTKAGAGGYQVGTLVLDPVGFDYYRVDSPTTVKPERGASGWKEMKNIMRYRKIDVSWQVNDPLVNSSERGWQGKVYAVKDFTDGTVPPASPVRGDGVRRIWSPGLYNQIGIRNINDFVYSANPDLTKLRLQARLGGNLCARNDKMLHWNAVGSPQDSSMQDPGVGPPNWWTFPDIHTRGGPQNAGWLGQVHRGTPWQTLYLKAKRKPGSIKVLQINDASGEVTTAGPHGLINGDTVSFTGTNPDEWLTATLSDATGPIEWTAPDRFKVMGVDLDGDGFPDSKFIGWGGGIGFYAPADLYLDTQLWKKWAGSSDTRPVNDRRLIDALTVSEGGGMQGRFSINNPSRAAWSGLLDGLSLPKRQVLGPAGGAIYYNRILGANIDHPTLNPFKNDRDNTLDALNDQKWFNLVMAINSLRSTQVPLSIFSRASDILGVEELTDKSPYLTEIITGIAKPEDYTTVGAGLADDLDLERIPQQLMSLLKAGGRQYYQTYIFTEQLRPARKNNIDGKEKPAVDTNRNVSNYEVAGHSARRVMFELIGASQWIESLKRGHFGQYRNQDGELLTLDPLYPRVIQDYPLSLDN
ncbi:MAG: hypothetical protein VX945_05640 [Verrucomicrobiota bacterium]|nr:hypothetical protein [Verrucomicrobiota bacterium]